MYRWRCWEYCWDPPAWWLWCIWLVNWKLRHIQLSKRSHNLHRLLCPVHILVYVLTKFFFEIVEHIVCLSGGFSCLEPPSHVTAQHPTSDNRWRPILDRSDIQWLIQWLLVPWRCSNTCRDFYLFLNIHLFIKKKVHVCHNYWGRLKWGQQKLWGI